MVCGLRWSKLTENPDSLKKEILRAQREAQIFELLHGEISACGLPVENEEEITRVAADIARESKPLLYNVDPRAYLPK